MKNYRAQTPKNLELTKILQNSAKRAQPREERQPEREGAPTYYLAKI